VARVKWSFLAESDLQQIYDYVSSDSQYYAGKLIDLLFARSSSLQDYPYSGRVVPEFDNPHIRELIEGKYRIVYEIMHSDEVVILRIMHTARLLR